MPDSEKYIIDIRPEAWSEISKIADKHLSLVGPVSENNRPVTERY